MPIKLIRLFCLFFLLISTLSFADADVPPGKNLTIDRIQLVTEQINLLKNRLNQTNNELTALQQQRDKFLREFTVDRVTKNLTDKMVLDMAVSSSNLDSINIELTDSQQTMSWLEKNSQEIQNQLNVVAIFGLKMANNQFVNTQSLHEDLLYQKRLTQLEKIRAHYLESLQTSASNILALQKDNYAKLTGFLKSRRMLNIKQQQVKDELAYQEKQNYWLQQLNGLYARLGTPEAGKDYAVYASVEREIFYANENANFAYSQSLIARYKDQIQEMRMVLSKNNSISLLSEMRNQLQMLSKQIDKLTSVLKTRYSILENRINYLAQNQKNDQQMNVYVAELKSMETQYNVLNNGIESLNKNLLQFRLLLDQALQVELASRQGLPTYSFKTLLDFGREILLLPPLAFQVVKSLSVNIADAFHAMSRLGWCLFGIMQGVLIFISYFCRRLLLHLFRQPASWHNKINLRWLGLRWLQRHFLDLIICGNIIGILFGLSVPLANDIFVIYLLSIWVGCKSILTIARLCLVETVHNAAGQDIRLYRWLRGLIITGGIIISLTVFMHLLPMIYELKILCDQLFLLLVMIVSLFLLRSWQVVPNLILSHLDLSEHPYLGKSIRLMGVLVPLLMLVNSVMGLMGFVNLIMTISWYEGIFLFVLTCYLILRGLLSKTMEKLSQLTIQYVSNGWLLTEAFLKPLDKVLRITLFLAGWATLFLLSGVDKQSPVFERLTRLFHYHLIKVLNTWITPINIIMLAVVISIFYWIAKWTREFVYRWLPSHTNDTGIRNSIAILSQYMVVVLGIFISLQVLGISLQALAVVAGMFAFGIGLGLRDLANNFACGFLILLERPLRVGDIVNVSGSEGEVTHIGGRAVTVTTWDNMELVVPNAEVFNKSFTNYTARDNIVRTVALIKVSRHDNPHELKSIIEHVLADHKDILKEPFPHVFLKELNENFILFELRYFVNIRKVHSRTSVTSSMLMNLWDTFASKGIQPPSSQYEVFLREGHLAPIPLPLYEDKMLIKG